MRTQQIAAIALTLLSVAGGAANAQHHMPRGSFLRQSANTSAELTRAVSNDPIILARYVHAFHITPDAIVSAFHNLKLVRLSQDRVCQVHYVHPGEAVGYRVRRVLKGTRVWEAADGTPVLAWVCGNPLRTEPSLAVGNANAQVGRLSTIPEFDPEEDLGQLAQNSEQTVSGLRSMEPTALPTVPAAPVAVAQAPEVQPLDVPVDAAPLQVASAAGVSRWANFAEISSAAGALAALLGGHSAQATSALDGFLPTEVTDGRTGPNPVHGIGTAGSGSGGSGVLQKFGGPQDTPEPGSIGMLAALLGSGTACFRKRRASR